MRDCLGFYCLVYLPEEISWDHGKIEGATERHLMQGVEVKGIIALSLDKFRSMEARPVKECAYPFLVQ